MYFSDYLRSCREENQLTQEQLVHDLYSYDTKSFVGLDTTTLSKWERGITKPRLAKQVSILKYFQQRSGTALPCLERYSQEEAEEMICEAGMHNLLGKSKELILNFPSKMIGADDLAVLQLRNSEMIDRIIDITIDLDKGFNHKFSQLLPRHFKEWALHPSNAFFVCEYQEQFFGLLFTLRLKPEAFEKIMNHEIREKDLTLEDLASFNEAGSHYVISFFAMNDKAANMLFIRFFAHLIAHQRAIEEVGLATMMEDARKLIKNMNLNHYADLEIGNGLILQTYRETLQNFLACEPVVKMILSKQECPEE